MQAGACPTRHGCATFHPSPRRACAGVRRAPPDGPRPARGRAATRFRMSSLSRCLLPTVLVGPDCLCRSGPNGTLTGQEATPNVASGPCDGCSRGLPVPPEGSPPTAQLRGASRRPSRSQRRSIRRRSFGRSSPRPGPSRSAHRSRRSLGRSPRVPRARRIGVGTCTSRRAPRSTRCAAKRKGG